MIQINLLPAKARKRRDNVSQFLYVYLLSVLLTAAAIGYVWISQSNEIEAANTRLAQLIQETAKYAKYEAMLKDLKQKQEVVSKKLEIIKGLQQDRDRIVRILALLSIQIPAEKMWFEKLSQASNMVTIDGVAMSNEAIVEFMRSLESSPYVEKGSVSLTHSRQRLISNMKLREFQVTYRFFPFSEVRKNLKAQAS